MTTIRAATIGTGLLVLAAIGGVGYAQAPATKDNPPADANGDMTGEIELTRAAIQVRRQALVTAAMDLEGKEADSFWPLYRDYRQAMAKVNDRYVKLLTSYLESYDTLTDEFAKGMMKEYLSIERDRTGVKATYVPKFSKVMPTKKVARFFQVDNKLDAIINSELAQIIPLVR
jgi:hypothetical protein